MVRYNKNTYWPILLAILCMLPLACETDSCLHGTGSTTRQYVETGFFHHMNVKGIFHIILVQDTTYYVEFEGGDKVLDYVSAVNTDSILWLDNTNRCFYLRDYEKIKAYVHFSHLNKVDLFEVSFVESMNPLDSLYYMTVQGKMAEINIELNSTRFGFYNNTTTGGLYTFRGYCDRFWIAAYYTAKFNTEELTARIYQVNNSSLSDLYVTANELLRVELHNKGNIYYSGSPQITIDTISGSGRLLPWVD